MNKHGNKNREQQILAHVTLYRLTVPNAVASFFSDYPKAERATKATNALKSLTRRKLVQSHQFPSKKHRFYTLPGAKLEPSTIDYDLALLSWCCLGKAKRRRVTREELRRLICDERLPHHHVRHCLGESATGIFCLYRMYPTAATKQLALQNLRKKHIPALKKCHPEMVECGDLGIAVLLDSKEKLAYVKREINKEPQKGGPPISHQVRIVLDVAPNSSNWSER